MCNCWICKRSRKFDKIIAKLPQEERDWMDGVFNSMFDSEEELELANIHIDDLRKIIRDLKSNHNKLSKKFEKISEETLI